MNIKDQVLSYRLKKYRKGMVNSTFRKTNADEEKKSKIITSVEEEKLEV